VMVPVAISGVMPEDWLMPEPPPHATATVAMRVASRICFILNTVALLGVYPQNLVALLSELT
jgi:hypothetical protein